MEAPILLLVGGSLLADLVVAGMLFAAVGVLGAAVVAIAATVLYVRVLYKAIRQKAWSWLTNLVLAPFAGPMIGYLVAIPTVAQLDHSPFNIWVLIAGLFMLYGVIVAWWHGPKLLSYEPQDELAKFAWVASYVSFAAAGFAVGMLAQLVAHGEAHW